MAQLDILGGCGGASRGTDQLLLVSAVCRWWSNSVLRQLTELLFLNSFMSLEHKKIAQEGKKNQIIG